jgi:hypothetical protein
VCVIAYEYMTLNKMIKYLFLIIIMWVMLYLWKLIRNKFWICLRSSISSAVAPVKMLVKINFIKNVGWHKKLELSNMLRVQATNNLGKYLGVLFVSHLYFSHGIVACSSICQYHLTLLSKVKVANILKCL